MKTFFVSIALLACMSFGSPNVMPNLEAKSSKTSVISWNVLNVYPTGNGVMLNLSQYAGRGRIKIEFFGPSYAQAYYEPINVYQPLNAAAGMPGPGEYHIYARYENGDEYIAHANSVQVVCPW
jgi:hypothetical protein